MVTPVLKVVMIGWPEAHCDKCAIEYKCNLINVLRINLKVASEFVWLVCREIATTIFGNPGKGSYSSQNACREIATLIQVVE